jgi:hypothetical protein
MCQNTTVLASRTEALCALMPEGPQFRGSEKHVLRVIAPQPVVANGIVCFGSSTDVVGARQYHGAPT